MTDQKLYKFLEERPALNLTKLEEEAGLTPATLSKYMRGQRNVPKSYEDQLIATLRKYGWRYKTIY